MKKILLLLLLTMAIGQSVDARTYVYDLRSFYVNKMPLYLTSPDKAQELLGKPLKREGHLNSTPGTAISVGMGGYYPWGGIGFRYPMYLNPPQLLATMVFFYENAVVYFDQDTMYGSAFITSMSMYSPEYVLYYGDKPIKVGDSFEALSSVFPAECAKKAKKVQKEQIVEVKVRVDAGAGELRQKGYVTFVIEKDAVVAIGVVLR